MNYRANPLNGDRLSILGFGCMRFPKADSEAEKLVMHAIESGVNYFDTAYIYGKSEERLGAILNKNGVRNKVMVATKISPALVNKRADFDKILDRQLARLKTDYIDYYLIHMLPDMKVWKRLVSIGVESWVDEKKASGVIKNIGFSYHGGRDEFIKIVDAYRWEFCMIQYNYLDENNQAGRRGLQHAAAKGMPVMVMEPLRGGTLVNNLPKSAAGIFEGAQPVRSPAEWSLRWIWDQPEVTCVLSGMGSFSALTENIGVASTAGSGDFTEGDHAVINMAKKAFSDANIVPCTGCGYCMPCRQGVDIPTCLSCYNNIVIEGKKMAALAKYMMQTSMKTDPQIASLCNGCGECEKRCPQGIKIRGELQNTAKAFEKFYFKPAMYLTRRFMKITKNFID